MGEWKYSFVNFDLGTRWRWVNSFTPRPLYPRGKRPRYPLGRRPDDEEISSKYVTWWLYYIRQVCQTRHRLSNKLFVCLVQAEIKVRIYYSYSGAFNDKYVTKIFTSWGIVTKRKKVDTINKTKGLYLIRSNRSKYSKRSEIKKSLTCNLV
jgi:hypothetical protein